MAAGNTARRKPGATQRSVALERFNRVRGAAWIIAAGGRQERRQRDLVAADEQNEKGAHELTTLREQRGAGAGPVTERGRKPPLDRPNIGAERVDLGVIRLMARPNCDIDRRLNAKGGEELDTDHLAESTLQSIAIDCCVLIARYDDPDPRSAERGSEYTDVEMHGPNSLPLLDD
jgi:hypothetical protein